MDANNNYTWRQGLPQDSRQKTVNRIMDTLQRHMPPTGSESIGELLKIAWRFEEKIFQAATDQKDYLRKISLKILSLETKAQAIPASAIQARIGNQAQNLSNGVQLPGAVSGPSQQRQQLIAQSLQNNLNANVMQSSSGLGSGLSSMTGMPQATLSGSSSQNMMFNEFQRMAIREQQQRQQQQPPPQQHQPPQQQASAHQHQSLIQLQLLLQQRHQQQQSQQQQQQVQQQQQPTALQSQSQQSQQPNSTQQLGQQPQQLQQLQSSSQQAQQQRLQQPDSSGHSRAGGVGLDHREVVWPKLQMLKVKYLQDMKELYGMLTQRSAMPMSPEQQQMVKHYKDVLQRMIPYLTVPKERIPSEFNQVEAFEKQIVNIMERFEQRRQATPQQLIRLSQQLLPIEVPQPSERQGQQQQQVQQH